MRRVNELDLLTLTADEQILSKLEKNGVDLETIESLLPLVDDLGLTETAGNSQQLLINLVAPLLIEPARLLIPAIGSALDIGPLAFFAPAAAFAGLEAYLVATDAQLPLVGLNAGVLAGLLLISLSLGFGSLVVGLSSAGSKK